MGLVAHPARITSIALSFDGRYLFTSGGNDLTTNMWLLDVECLCSYEQQSSTEEPIDPYLELLEGGAGGDLHNDIVDYFYYVQLRSQGENCLEERKITGKCNFIL